MSNKLFSNVYLTFNGNCREAMTFYNDCLGGKLEMMDFGDSPVEVPASGKKLVLHSNIQREGITLMASDTTPDRAVTVGQNASISINCENAAQADSFYNKLSVGGKQTMPMQKTFWGAYFGMLTDKFGVQWMFNFDEPK
ncbi:MAG TPA: VOC family protein [Bacteroidia bacterium]|jgi:PhnB protein|nr:VOC family protein [Bacteroidia bacterium]